MDLICEKYNEKVAEDNARCRHPKEYCKYRTACIIHFLSGVGDSNDATESTKEKAMIPTLRFDKGNGLLPAIVQDFTSKEILMLAYINELAWEKTLTTGKAHYWSRSRNKLWLKGETSGHLQIIRKILVDCDEDTVVYQVEQLVIQDTEAVFSGRWQKINWKQLINRFLIPGRFIRNESIEAGNSQRKS